MAIAVTCCAGPPVLERQVLGYDEVTKSLDEKLLLLNIARVANYENVHFTSTSSIAATFDRTTTIGIGGQVEEPKGIDFFDFNLGASASENPTFSILPVSGEDFTKRIVTPFVDDTFEFLVFQGGGVNQVMRLLGAGIEIQNPDGSFFRFIENDPRRPTEYEEFRRISAHLQWLNDNLQLFVRSLVFEETMVADFRGDPRAEDINNGFNMGLRWQQKEDGSYKLTRLKAGRVVVSNFDPMALTDQERFELNEKIRKNPGGFVYLDIRPAGPGGDFPVQGAIKLRSMFQMLAFLARGIRSTQEFDVQPDPRTGQVRLGFKNTLNINVTEDHSDRRIPTVEYEWKYYSVDDTPWDRGTFSILSVLFQTAVGETQNIGIPITIAK